MPTEMESLHKWMQDALDGLPEGSEKEGFKDEMKVLFPIEMVIVF